MKKVLMLNCIVLSLLSFQSQAIKNSGINQNSDIKFQEIAQTNRAKYEQEKINRPKQIRKETDEAYVEPKTCSLMTTVVTGVTSFFSGLIIGLVAGGCILLKCLGLL